MDNNNVKDDNMKLYTSKRRGKVLLDPISIERRNWYENLQANVLQEQLNNTSNTRNTIIKDSEVSSSIVSHKDLLKLKNNNNNKKVILDDIKNNVWIHALNSPINSNITIICFPGT